MKNLLLALVLITICAPALAAEKESAMDRIIRTGVIRCGYYVFPPMTIRDPNTNELTGFTVDYMNKLAERASLKIEWTTEFTWANWIPEIQSGRFDVACTPMWMDMAQLKAVSFSHSMFYAGLYPLVRKDDPRFAKGTLDEVNNPETTIVTQEGNMTDPLARTLFPKAKFYTLPPTASSGEFFQSLLTKKADVMTTDRNGFSFYEKTNGKQFKFIATDKPLKLQSFRLAALKNEVELISFLNQAVEELDYNGETDRLLRKWEPEPGVTYLRAANPYKGQK